MEWTSAEEKCFSNMKELVKSYCQSGQLIELYTQLLPCSVAWTFLFSSTYINANC